MSIIGAEYPPHLTISRLPTTYVLFVNLLINNATHLFAVEPDCGCSIHVLIELHPVQNGGLSRHVESNHCTVYHPDVREMLRQGGLFAHIPTHLQVYSKQHSRPLYLTISQFQASVCFYIGHK